MEYRKTAAQTAKINGFVFNGKRGKNAAVIDFSVVDNAAEIPVEIRDGLKEKILKRLTDGSGTALYDFEWFDGIAGTSHIYVDAEITRTPVYVDDVRKYFVFTVCGLRYASHRVNLYGIAYNSMPDESGIIGTWYTDHIPCNSEGISI